MNTKIPDKYTLSYKQNGFVLRPDCIPKPLVSNAYKGAQQVLNGHYDTGVAPWGIPEANEQKQIQRVYQIHLANHAVRKLLTSSPIGQLAADIMSAKRIQLVVTQLYLKPVNSGTGGQVGFHRDIEHFFVFTKGAINAWLPLTDLSENMGTLTYVNGSHDWPVSSLYTGIKTQDIAQQRKLMQAEVTPKLWCETLSVDKAGGIGFHHPYCLHGSGENIDNNDRFAIGMSLITDQVEFNGNATEAKKMLADEDTYPVIYQA